MESKHQFYLLEDYIVIFIDITQETMYCLGDSVMYTCIYGSITRSLLIKIVLVSK